jgi:hypothetical protein
MPLYSANKLFKILTRTLLVALYIYAGEWFKYWGSNVTIKVAHWEAPITIQWFVTFVVIYLRPLLLVAMWVSGRKDSCFLIWSGVIIATYCLLDFIWWINFFEEKEYYWLIFWIIALVDTFVFRKYWMKVFKNTP